MIMKRTIVGLGGIAISAFLVVAPLNTADAADLPVKVPLPPPPVWTWTGFYLGIQGGAGWGTSRDLATAEQCTPFFCGGSGAIVPISIPGSTGYSAALSGWHGGGTVGFNWQRDQVVFSVEADISGAAIDGTADCDSFANALPVLQSSAPATCSTKLKSFGTLTGRLGIVIDRALVYIKGGGAWGDFNHSILLTTCTFGACFDGAWSGSRSESRWGATAGVGVEYAFWNNWSAKIEYDYMDFGTKNIEITLTDPVHAGVVQNVWLDDRERVHVIKAGLNYRFNWWGGPIVTRY
jgi:outer membrane immunogenic protein